MLKLMIQMLPLQLLMEILNLMMELRRQIMLTHQPTTEDNPINQTIVVMQVLLAHQYQQLIPKLMLEPMSKKT